MGFSLRVYTNITLLYTFIECENECFPLANNPRDGKLKEKKKSESPNGENVVSTKIRDRELQWKIKARESTQMDKLIEF